MTAMAVVRCSITAPPPLSDSTSGRPIFHRRNHPCPESMDAFSSSAGKNNMSLYKKSTKIEVPFKSCQNIYNGGPMTSNSMQNVELDVLEKTRRPGFKVSNDCDFFLAYISKYKREASSIVNIFLIANASSMIDPLMALAETSDRDNSIASMPLLFAIAMIGAAVGGLLARQRKNELAKLNDQLRQINAALRRQAKIESYAPNLSYAPVSRVPETEVIVDPRKEQLMTNLRTGKIYLRNQDPEKAYLEFKAAFDLADDLGDHIEKKKAARGLGASLQRQGKYREAIDYHSKVLEIAGKSGEYSGSTEAYGAIADCYTEIGDLERAGKFYDKYIARLETD